MQYMDIRIRRIVKRCEDLRAQDCVLVRRRLGKRDCRIVGVIVVFDATNGLPIGILDGITGLRTGAARAIGAKYLARPES